MFSKDAAFDPDFGSVAIVAIAFWCIAGTNIVVFAVSRCAGLERLLLAPMANPVIAAFAIAIGLPANIVGSCLGI